MRSAAVSQKRIGCIDKDKYDVVLIGIDKAGKWHWHQDYVDFLNDGSPELLNFIQVPKSWLSYPAVRRNR